MTWSRWRPRWKRPDGAPVSMTLTSTLLRRRTSRRKPRIPTIPAGRFHGETFDVSAVDTEPLWDRVLGAPMWCVKWRWVAVSKAVGCRGGCCGSWCAGSGCGGGPGRGRFSYGGSPGCVCAGSSLGRRGRSDGERASWLAPCCSDASVRTTRTLTAQAKLDRAPEPYLPRECEVRHLSIVPILTRLGRYRLSPVVKARERVVWVTSSRSTLRLSPTGVLRGSSGVRPSASASLMTGFSHGPLPSEGVAQITRPQAVTWRELPLLQVLGRRGVTHKGCDLARGLLRHRGKLLRVAFPIDVLLPEYRC